jgi:hypothetical protein
LGWTAAGRCLIATGRAHGLVVSGDVLTSAWRKTDRDRFMKKNVGLDLTKAVRI